MKFNRSYVRTLTGLVTFFSVSLTPFVPFNSILSSLRLLPTEQPMDWQVLFDGRTLENWQVTNFGGEGEVRIEADRLILDFGSSLTGITWTGKVPSVNYEVSLEAMRVDGNDFFCGLTFPVKQSSCSLIVGGWGGTVVGLSSVDGLDASENETSKLMTFQTNQWYQVRLRVTNLRIEAWIDEEKVVDLETLDRKLSIRPEVDLSRPFGIASWRTKAALRAIKLRRIDGN